MKFAKKAISRTLGRYGLEIRKRRHPLLGLDLESIDSVIDIGANRGQFLSEALEMFPNAQFHCFEPLESAMRELIKVQELHCDRQITLHPTALGNEEGEKSIHHHNQHDSSSSFLNSTDLSHSLYPQTEAQREEIVEINRLDGIIDRDSLGRIFIKMDVQGFEGEVLQGGRETFLAAHACMLELCIDQLYVSQSSPEDLIAALKLHGLFYRGNIRQFLAPDGHVIYADALFLRGDVDE